MTSKLYRLGIGAAAHPWRTISAWLVVIAVAIVAAVAFGGTPHDDYNVPGSRSQVGVDQVREHFPSTGAAGSTAQVVVHDPSGRALPADGLAALTDRLAAIDHVTDVTTPRMSADGDTALYTVTYDVPVTDDDLVGEEGLEPLEQAIAPLQDAGLQAALGGELPGNAGEPLDGRGELIGVLAALILLVIMFGSVVGAGLPIAVALTGLGVGTAGVTLLAATTDVSTSAPTIATMVGLGVGIDYALLLVSRHVEFLHAGHAVREAAGRAVATAGRSVVFASATVLVSLMGLRLAGLPVYSSFGFATGIAVVSVMAAAITLVPALCGLAGPRLLPRRERKGRIRGGGAPLTARWAAVVGRRPLPWALAALLLLLVLAAPTLGMRTWPQDSSSNPADSTTRQAFDIIDAEFGPGANGPITFVVDRAKVGDAGVAEAVATVRANDAIAGVTEPVTSPDGVLAVFDAEPVYAPSDERIPDLVADLRAELDDTEVTGLTPIFADISDLLSERIWVVVGFVVLVSVLLLAMMFRSIVVPIKAAVMNLLSIGAAYGVLTAAIQWGWATELLGLDHAMPVSSWIPILMFAILFGLSMDYEVFLLSRIREDWLRTGDPRESVVRGLSATGRVISSAAAIMVAVFLGFATESSVVVKMLGFGMAVAIVLDATVVRLILVPATMAMLGRWNWWLPAWLDRLLPTIAAEAPEDVWDELDSLPAASSTHTSAGV